MKKEIRQPDFSVIMPVFNGEKYIGEALSSVFADPFDSYEVIVVDDGSTDNTAEVARSFPGVKHQYQPNQGVAVARNTGIQLARGKYIAFLDSDDVWASGRFAKSFEVLENNPMVQYLLGQLIMFLEDGCIKPSHIRDEWLEKQMDSVGAGVMTARRTVFDQVGLFNPSYRVGEDAEWLLRAKEKGTVMKKTPFLVIRRRLHNNNLTNAGSTERKARTLKMLRESLVRKNK